jgi:PII-like signaling protein
VSDGYLKLTTYFAERQRSEGRFLADALLDLYSDNAVATSVVLRGIASFGPHHVLRTDQTLSASEDPPVAVAAVDTADKMAALADQVVAMTTRGLVTLERARMIGQPDATSPDTAKLTVYLGRYDRIAGQPAHQAICAALYRHGFAGASVFLGVDGTSQGRRQRARFFSRNVNVPVMIIAIGTASQVAGVTGELRNTMPDPLWTIERVRLCKRDGQLLAPPPALPPTDDHGRPLWQKLMIYTSEATHHGGVPIHRALVRRLRESDAVSGATVLRGVWGFHGAHEPHGDKLFQLSRQVPVTTIVVDTPARIAAGFQIVDELTAEHGLVTSELVPALVAVDGADRVGDTELAHFDY